MSRSCTFEPAQRLQVIGCPRARSPCSRFSFISRAVVKTRTCSARLRRVMAQQRADIEKFIEDKNIYNCGQDQRGSEKQLTKLASSEAVLNRMLGSSSIAKQSAADISDVLEDTITEDIESDSSLADDRLTKNIEESNVQANRELSTGRILHVEKDINIRVNLKCLLQIDESTKNYVGKILTSVRCESAVPDAISNPRRNGDSSSNEDAERATQDNAHVRSPRESSKRTKMPLTETAQAGNDEEWTNMNMLTSALMKFTNSEIHDADIRTTIDKVVDGPSERIHFSTPEAERKWRNIVEQVTHGRQKLSASKAVARNSRRPIGVTDLSTVDSSRKRKIPETSTEQRRVCKSKAEGQMIDILGPIPHSGSTIFQGMSFVLECISLESIDPQQLETMGTNSEAENLEEWTRRPFVRDRLIAQINAGGGKPYERSELVPPEKYASTKLIMNIPSITADSLFCLSVGIEAHSHQWIIRCCQENKIVNPAEERLPAGWSLMRQSYVEMYQRPSQKPFQSDLPFVVVIPMHPSKKRFVSFWERIIANAGGAVLVVEEPDDEFMEGTVVLAHSCIPAWVMRKAEDCDIPIVTTRWAIQCLIEGQICDYDAHPSFEYNF